MMHTGATARTQGIKLSSLTAEEYSGKQDQWIRKTNTLVDQFSDLAINRIPSSGLGCFSETISFGDFRCVENLSFRALCSIVTEKEKGVLWVRRDRLVSLLDIYRKYTEHFTRQLRSPDSWRPLYYEITRPGESSKKVYLVCVPGQLEELSGGVGCAKAQEFWQRAEGLLSRCVRLCEPFHSERVQTPLRRSAEQGGKELLPWETEKDFEECVEQGVSPEMRIELSSLQKMCGEDRNYLAHLAMTKRYAVNAREIAAQMLGRSISKFVHEQEKHWIFDRRVERLAGEITGLFLGSVQGNSMVTFEENIQTEAEGGIVHRLREQGYSVSRHFLFREEETRT